MLSQSTEDDTPHLITDHEHVMPSVMGMTNCTKCVKPLSWHKSYGELVADKLGTGVWRDYVHPKV